MAVLCPLLHSNLDVHIGVKPDTSTLLQGFYRENYLMLVDFQLGFFSQVSTQSDSSEPARADRGAADYFNISAYLNPAEAINAIVSLSQCDEDNPHKLHFVLFLIHVENGSMKWVLYFQYQLIVATYVASISLMIKYMSFKSTRRASISIEQIFFFVLICAHGFGTCQFLPIYCSLRPWLQIVHLTFFLGCRYVHIM